MIHHKNKLTPYLGMELYGQVETTIVGGKVAYQRGAGFSDEPEGRLLLDNIRRLT
jgi:dihydroorotase-like cyclic amidohydrolase